MENRRRILHYERRVEPLLSRSRFVIRLVLHLLVALAVVFVALAVGVAGYLYLEPVSFVDAFYGATMLLTGMGPVSNVAQTTNSKIFSSFYALLVGPVLLSIGGIILAPIIHRLLHRFHLEQLDNREP